MLFNYININYKMLVLLLFWGGKIILLIFLSFMEQERTVRLANFKSTLFLQLSWGSKAKVPF